MHIHMYAYWDTNVDKVVCACVQTCRYTYTHIGIQKYMYKYLCVSLSVYVSIYSCMSLYLSMYLYTSLCRYLCVCLCVCLSMYLWMCKQICTDIDMISISVLLHTQKAFVYTRRLLRHTKRYTWKYNMFEHIYAIYMYTWILIYIDIDI